MASMAVFATSWRDSNYAVRANNHRNKKTIKMKTLEVSVKSIHGVHLTRHRGVGLGQPCPNGIGLLFGGMKGRLRDPEMDLKLAIFSSRFGIAVLGRPPLLEKAPGVVAIVRVGRSNDKAGAEDTASKGPLALGRGRRLSFTMNL